MWKVVKPKKNYEGAKVALESTLLTIFAEAYWVSAGMAQVYGTDYFYDVVFTAFNTSLWGKVVFKTLMILFPLGALIMNLVTYKKLKRHWQIWAIVISGILVGLGIFEALRSLF